MTGIQWDARVSREVNMTIMQNRTMLKRLQRLRQGSTDDIRNIISLCEAEPGLQTAANMVRVIANTGVRNGEFAKLRIADIDPSGTWLTIHRHRSGSVRSRVIPIRQKTHTALLALHQLNPDSEFVLGDTPRTRFDCMIRKLILVAPEFGRTRQRTYSIRKNFEYRLMSAGIPAGVVKYLLGCESLTTSIQQLTLTPEERMQIVQRTLERFIEEL